MTVYIICDKTGVPVGLEQGKYDILYAYGSKSLADMHCEKGQTAVPFKSKKGKKDE